MFFLVFIIGACLGSFLNVIVDRISTGRSVVRGRSYCEKCNKTLQPIDLIPVVSFLLLRGRCRYCKAKIPPRILFVEILTGSIFVLIAMQVLTGAMLPVSGILLALILLCFVGIFFADIQYGIIPDVLVVASLFLSLFYVIFSGGNLLFHILAGLGSFIFFLILYLITKGRGMGLGDVKFALVLGLLLGYPLVIVCLYLAFLTGAAVSIILVVWKKIRFFGGTIPFGPFLVLSAIVTLFYGDKLLKIFLQLFF